MEEQNPIYEILQELYCWGKAYVTEPKAVRLACRQMKKEHPQWEKWDILLHAVCKVSEKKYFRKTNNV